MNINYTYGQRVTYIPHHANGNENHEDCEMGTVSSQTGGVVFVKFDKQVLKLGWDGTTSQACAFDRLKLAPEGFRYIDPVIYFSRMRVNKTVTEKMIEAGNKLIGLCLD